MHALVSHSILGTRTVSWNTNGIMVLNWILLSPYSLETNGIMAPVGQVFGDLDLTDRRSLPRGEAGEGASGRREKLLGLLGYGCSSHHILLEHGRNYILRMDAPVTVFLRNTNGI